MTKEIMAKTQKTIVLSAGGSGGHLFPAEALAAELIRRGHRVVIFTDKRGHAFRSLGDDVTIHTVRAATLRAGIRAKLRAVFDMAFGTAQAFFTLRNIKPDVVVGFGGYPSVPAVLAAQIAGRTTILHEQNAVLGKANHVLAARAKKIALSFDPTANIRPQDRGKTIVTGNPVRAPIIAAGDTPYQPPAAGGDIHILVTGGSQAASIFGEVVPAAMATLPADLRRRIRVMHQSRQPEIAATHARYATAGITADIQPFFTDMAARLTACHLFIGRAGASTVTEIAAVGKPAIFVPYPGNSDLQQKHNAAVLVEKGGGFMIMQEDLTALSLGRLLHDLLLDSVRLSSVAAAAKSCGQTTATQKLADAVEQQIF